ncbi:P-loop containing nucleoside triphosphate hydrolase protein [Panaeolus papilionaceus]|nr:P-loop containing nucleoside triphosphate hydrolase protein [Panaeolus papilionaceus]
MLANKKIPEFQVVFTNEMDVTETKDYLEINEEDIVIIVMGATGSGKSSFIKNATGYDLRIGEEADSCTQNLQVIRMLHGDRKIYLVDTPGFNDTNTSDIKIFNLIANWLRDRFINDVYVSGVVYLHKISDTRIGGIARRNFQVFEQLCGRECFHKVMLATTMWNEETEEDGQKKETQLKDRYFKSMMQQDAKLRRLDDDQDSAQRLLTAVINNATNLCPLLLQKELVSLHKSLPETHAGQYLYRKLGDILCTKQDKLAQLHSNSAEAGDALLEFVQLQKEIQEIMKEMQENRLSMPTRLMQFLQSRFR